MSSQLATPPVSLPDYALVRRLGAGGYGEVWMAEAPGGFAKAIKVVYGHFDENRAEHELRALLRMKDVRHPFLLSLERIDRVDGRLVIVMELAERSLRDCFEMRQAAGAQGVERGALLRYLTDAADALDFLGERHGLQHLDVKPENLLVVGDHLKVADFGLVKDLAQPQASLVGGLTPLYSAPEVFRGAPTRWSDQYSLALVFVELLTGRLPFSGGTPAELALQHLHDAPELDALLGADRFVIARALAKQPEARFSTCAEFVERLKTARSAWGAAWDKSEPAVLGHAHAANGESGPETGPESREAASTAVAPWHTATQVCVDASLRAVIGAGDAELPVRLRVAPPPDATVRRLAPATQPAPPQLQPALIVGVGGMGGMVLHRLRQAMRRRFGADSPLGAIQLLALDTDRQALTALTRGAEGDRLTSAEVLAVPLRRPHEYRDDARSMSVWLSRRWLYNIPKSLRTEGLRPLGRLAFWSHAQRISQRLRMAAIEAMDEGAVLEAERQLGMRVTRERLRVFVVGSVSGGAGGGMTLDVGFALRQALGRLDVPAAIVGLFVHAARGQSGQADLARVNAYSWLAEYERFHSPGATFPGDATCGMAAQPSGEKAYDHAYLIDAEQVSGACLESKAETLAEYLVYETLTAGGSYFDACRAASSQGRASNRAALRSLQLQQVEARPDAAEKALTGAVCRRVVLGWLGGQAAEKPAAPRSATRTSAAHAGDTDQIIAGVGAVANRLKLSLEGMAANARRLLESQFEPDLTAYVEQLTRRLAQQNNATRGGVCAAIDAELLDGAGSVDPLEAHLGSRRLTSVVAPLALGTARELEQWVLSRLDERQERLAGALRAVDWLTGHLDVIERDALRLCSVLTSEAEAFAQDRRPERRSLAVESSEDLAEQGAAYVRLRLDLASVYAAALLARRVKSQLRRVGEVLDEFERQVRLLSHSFAGNAEELSQELLQASSVAQESLKMCDEILAVHGSDLAAEAAQEIQRALQSHGGVFQAVLGNPALQAQIKSELQRLVCRKVQAMLQRVESVENLMSLEAMRELDEALEARPHGAATGLLAYGAETRSTLFCPPNWLSDGRLTWRRSPDEPWRALPSLGGTILACTDAADVPLGHVACALIDGRRDLQALARKVHTRCDVDWPDLIAEVAQEHAATTDAALVGCSL